MTELKPCPFCGKEVRLSWVIMKGKLFFIRCNRCKIELTMHGTDDIKDKTAERITKLWNYGAGEGNKQ